MKQCDRFRIQVIINTLMSIYPYSVVEWDEESDLYEVTLSNGVIFHIFVE